MRYTLQNCTDVASERGGKCLSDKYVCTKLDWECSKGHKWKAAFSHIKAGTWCPECKTERVSKSRRTPISSIHKFASHKSWKFLDNEFKNNHTKHKWMCDKGHVFEKAYRHLKQGIGCPDCNNYFSSENKFRQFIEACYKLPFPKCRPEWLVNPETGYKLELDCYNKQLGLAFEYDGHFHFEVRKGFDNDLDKTQKLDKLKNKLCEENGIILVRIPYFLKGQALHQKIIDSMKLVFGEKYWLIIRELDEGTPCPIEIKQARAEARAKIV